MGRKKRKKKSSNLSRQARAKWKEKVHSDKRRGGPKHRKSQESD